MQTVKVKCGKGLNRDIPPWELELGYWSDCANMRFRNGIDERVGGIAAVFTTPTNIPYALGTFDVGTTTGSKRYLVEVGLAKAHVDDGTTRTEITRGKHGFTSTLSGTGATITVTTTASHGLSTGDNVIVAGVTPAGYNTGNSGATITVASATTFTYAGSESGAVTVNGYWDSNRTEDFTALAGEEISICVLNGVLYVNTLLDGCYYWAGATTGAEGRLRRLRSLATNSHNNPYGRTVRSYKDFLLFTGQFNANTATSTGATKKPYTIGWPNSTEPSTTPTTFTASSTNDAGSVQKTRGAMVDGLEFGDTFYLYQERGMIAVDYIGSNDVFSFRYLPGADGLLAPNCIVNTPKGQVFLSQNLDVKIHTGGEAQSIAEGRILNWLRSNIDSTYQTRAFLTVNRKFSEVWVCIPTTGNSTCNKALLWNWESNSWGERTLSGVTCGVSGMLPTTVATDERLVIGTTTPTIGLVDSGTTDFGVAYTSSVERTGLHLEAPDRSKFLHTSRIFVDSVAAETATVYHGSHPLQETAASYSSGVTYTHNTTRDICVNADSAQYLAYKYTTTASVWRARSLEFEFEAQGRF